MGSRSIPLYEPPGSLRNSLRDNVDDRRLVLDQRRIHERMRLDREGAMPAGEDAVSIGWGELVEHALRRPDGRWNIGTRLQPQAEMFLAQLCIDRALDVVGRLGHLRAAQHMAQQLAGAADDGATLKLVRDVPGEAVHGLLHAAADPGHDVLPRLLEVVENPGDAFFVDGKLEHYAFSVCVNVRL